MDRIARKIGMTIVIVRVLASAAMARTSENVAKPLRFG